jgi:hypothetical protein
VHYLNLISIHDVFPVIQRHQIIVRLLLLLDPLFHGVDLNLESVQQLDDVFFDPWILGLRPGSPLRTDLRAALLRFGALILGPGYSPPLAMLCELSFQVSFHVLKLFVVLMRVIVELRPDLEHEVIEVTQK